MAGHCGVFGNFFYVFHVPLFFFLSGITYRDSSSLPFRCWLWPELKKLLRRLWLPFVLFNGLFLLGHNLFFRLGWYSSSLSFREYPERIFRILTFGGGEQLLGALWFLIVLWELSLLFRLLLTGISFLPRQFRLPLLLLIILLGCYVGAHTTLPRSFHRALYFLPFYSSGFLLRHWLRSFLTSHSPRVLLFLFLAFLLPVGAATYIHLSYEDLSLFPYSLLSAFGGIGLCLVGGQLLLSFPRILPCLTFCGRYSFWVMALHFVGFKLFAALLYGAGRLSREGLAAFPIPADLSLLCRLGFFLAGVLVSLSLGVLFRTIVLCSSPSTSSTQH